MYNLKKSRTFAAAKITPKQFITKPYNEFRRKN